MSDTRQLTALDIGFELSNLCNLHCDHCIRGSVQSTIDHLDLDLFRSVIDQARTLVPDIGVVFTGGEPLAAPFFPEAVNALAARDTPYRFVTNGWLVPRHIALLTEHRPAFVRISLSGGTEHTHDASRGRGSFRRALLGAAVLMTRGIRAELSMVVTRSSRGELSDAVAVAAELGVPELHFILPQPTPESVEHDLDLSPREWDEATEQVRRLARASPVTIGLDYGTRIPAPRERCRTMAVRQIYVDARGRVPFCCQLARYGTGDEPVVGDLRVEPLADVIARAFSSYEEFHVIMRARAARGATDDVDEFPCLSCARHHGQTGFLAAHPSHPWAALARIPA